MSATTSSSRQRWTITGGRILPRLTTRGPAVPREILVYGVIVAVVGAAVLFEHVLKSGFYADDYYYRDAWLVESQGSFWRGVKGFYDNGLLHGRPSLGFYLSLLNEAFGSHQRRYAAWSAVLACVFSVCVYVMLRVLRMRPIDAGLIGLLVLVFPAADSTRAWPIVSDAEVAMSLVLLGVSCSISSLSRSGRRAIAFRVGGLALIAMGVTVYELTFVAILAAFLLYRTRVGWRRALITSVPDWVLLILIYVLFTRHTELPRVPRSQIPGHTWTIIRDAATLLVRHAMFFGSTAAGLVVIGMILAAAFVVRWQLPGEDATRRAIDRWLVTIAIAIVMLAAAYAIYAPASPYYEPLETGLFNRTNAFAALPMLVIVYGLAALVGLLVFRGVQFRFAATLTTAGIAVALGIGYTIDISHDLRLWDSAYRRAGATLSSFKAAVPTLPHGAVVVFYGQPFEEASNIPIWSFPYDLEDALQLEYRNFNIQALGAQTAYKVNCMRGDVNILNIAYPTPVPATIAEPYGLFYMYQTNTGAVARPLNQAQCLQQVTQFVPGPYDATNPGADDPPL